MAFLPCGEHLGLGHLERRESLPFSPRKYNAWLKTRQMQLRFAEKSGPPAAGIHGRYRSTIDSETIG